MNNLITNCIFEYYDAITSGRIRVGKWILLIYKILVEGIKSREWIFDYKKANKAINFIENLFPQLGGAKRPFEIGVVAESDRFRHLRNIG